MSEALTIDEILARADTAAAQALSVPSMTEEMKRVAVSAKHEATRETAAHFLYTMMLGTETLFDGSKPDAGQLLDDAITHFLASLQAEIGKGYTSHCAATMIRNIALFLEPGKRDRVLMALEIEGRNR